MIERTQVEYIAELARLKLNDEEIDAFTRQIGDILQYMEQLNGVDTSHVDPTCFLNPMHDPVRADSETPSLTNEQALQNAPLAKRDFFAIPKVIG